MGNGSKSRPGSTSEWTRGIAGGEHNPRWPIQTIVWRGGLLATNGSDRTVGGAHGCGQSLGLSQSHTSTAGDEHER